MIKTNLLALGAISMLLLSSCTEAFRHKMEVADKYVDDMKATGVTCGASAATSNGESTSQTMLTFTGCDPDVEDIEREWTANRVANEFLGEMTGKDLEGETHLQIIAETGKNNFDYTFELDKLKRTDEYLDVVNEAVEACIAADTLAVDALKDDELMPDDQMYQIYNVLVYNDSIYGGQKLDNELLGYRFTTGVDDPDLKLFSADYVAKGAEATTRYTINIDCDTKKVVYIWVKTL
jgi:hypothetical protein